ncbi:MAG: 50S ribosomal protein L25 [Anaerolineae bacterium]|nr:50S ribosomal protein L25 [Anaerolineae bacterium]
MSQTYVLEAEARATIGKKVSQLRRDGLVPGIIYGSKIEPLSIQMPARALQSILMRAGGTHLIDVSVGGQPYSVLARDVQRHVIRGDILHVDFLAVDASSTITAEVPVRFINESPAVRGRLGILLQNLSKLTIEALPANLIDSVDVDLSTLMDVGDALHVRDLTALENVTILNDQSDMLVRVVPTSAALSEEEEEAEGEVEETEGGEPEVIGRGKKEEEEDED